MMLNDTLTRLRELRLAGMCQTTPTFTS